VLTFCIGFDILRFIPFEMRLNNPNEETLAAIQKELMEDFDADD